MDESKRNRIGDRIAESLGGCGFIVFFVIPIAMGLLMLLVLIYEMIRPFFVELLK